MNSLNNNLKFWNSIKLVVSAMLLIFPCITVFYLSAKVLAKALDEQRGANEIYRYLPYTKVVPAILLLLLFVALVLALAFYKKNRALLVLIIVGVAIRLIFFFIYKDVVTPFSDFLYTYDIAKGDMTLAPSRTDNWFMWAAMQYYLVQYFGMTYSGFAFLTTIFNIITAFFLYKIGMEAWNDVTLSSVGVILYLYMPSQILYELCVTPDAFSLMLITIAMFLALRLLKDINWRRGVISAIIIGTCIGVSLSAKGTGYIILVAIVIVSCFYTIELAKRHDNKNIISVIVRLVIVVVLTLTIPKMIMSVSEKTLGCKSNVGGMMHYICVGLNTEGNGQFKQGPKANFYFDKIDEGYSPQEASAATVQMLKDDWKQNYDRLPKLFEAKYKYAWNDDARPLYFFSEHSIDINRLSSVARILYEWIMDNGSMLCQGYYFILIVLTTIGVIVNFKRVIVNNGYFMVSLFVVGYVVLLFIIESQSRYKSTVLPFMCVLAAGSILKVNHLNERKKRIY